ncbi:MAG: hypothetical protein LBC38_01240, partial [Oscillospiraceae bacterium]|nr:hypothetical protein [Oscillospiraceae bacterium]
MEYKVRTEPIIEGVAITATAASIPSFKEQSCIHTKKIYDSCKDKDCVEDVRVYLDIASQELLKNALGVRAKLAELLFVAIDVEPIAYITGHYTVDLRYYYRITVEAYQLGNKVDLLTGLAIFDKRVTLCGGPIGAKTFSSQYLYGTPDIQNAMQMNMPTAVVEAIDPIILNIKVLEPCDCPQGRYGYESGLAEIPEAIRFYFPTGITMNVCEPGRRLYVSIGQFSIIRLERDTQIMIPVYDYCLPDKECAGISGGSDDPCELFSLIDFPVSSFFPPSCGPVSVAPVAPITPISP